MSPSRPAGHDVADCRPRCLAFLCSPSTKRAVVRLIAIALCGLLAGSALAQTTADTEAQRHRDREEALERQRRQQAPDVRLPAPEVATDADATDLPAETPCFAIDSVVLDGARHQAFAGLQQSLAVHAGRCIGREGIGLIVKRLTAQLIAEGYVTTRVGIPEQDLSSRQLRIVLVPGVIRRIRVVRPGDDGGADLGVGDWRTAFPARPGDLLNLRALEQGLEQMKRVPSQEVDIAIVPGEAPGESEVVLTVRRGKPWRLGFSLDDAGARATGKMQSALSLAVDNPFGANDLFSVSLSNDADHRAGQRGSDGHALQYSIPWGNWTLSLSEGRNTYHQRVQGINQSFVSSGESENQEIRVQRLLHRNATGKTALQFRTLRREQHSFLDDTEILVQRRVSVAAELALQHRRRLGEAQLDLSLARRQGVSWLDGMRDAAAHAPGTATFAYTLHTVDLALATPIRLAGLPLRWNVAFRAQETRDTLYASDQFAIGNRYTVRGFDGENTLAAERGWTLRNELEVPLSAIDLKAPPGHALFIGVDHGRVSGPGAAQLIGKRLTGAVFGLRGSSAGVAYEVFAGWGLKKPNGFQSKRPTAGFQLSYLY